MAAVNRKATPDITDYDVTEAMILYGGGFASRLGRLFRTADAVNQKKLKQAFPDYWKTYSELVEVQRAEKAEPKP